MEHSSVHRVPLRERENCENVALANVIQAVALLNEAIAQFGTHRVNNHLRGSTKTSLRSGLKSHRGSRDSSSSSLDLDIGEASLLPRWQKLNMDDDRVHDCYMECIEEQRDDFRRGHNMSRARTFSLMSSSASLDFGMVQRGKCTWTIHPQSLQRFAWDILSVLFITWDLLILPLHTFDLISVYHVLEVADWCVTLFWTLDMVMSLRTGFYKKEKLEMRAAQIGLQYARSWMIVDILIVTTEWLACLSVQYAEGANAGRFQRLRVMARYLRGGRVAKLTTFTNKFSAGMRSFHAILCFSLLKIIAVLLLICHYIGCGWHTVGNITTDGWVHKENAPSEGSYRFAYLYVSACRWTLAQINGRTDLASDRNMLERGYTTMCAFFTIVFYSLFISALTTRMVELMGILTERQKGMRILNTYASHHKLSWRTVYLARNYLMNHHAKNLDGETEISLLGLLPDHLQWDLLYEVRSPTVVEHPFMRKLNRKFIAAFRHVISTTMSNVFTQAHQIVFEPGVPCRRVLFNVKGDLRYNLDSNYKEAVEQISIELATTGILRGVRKTKIMKGNTHEIDIGQTVRPSACLSEAALWIAWKHKGALVAISESHLFAVDVEKFSDVLVNHVEAETLAAVYAWNFAVQLKTVEIWDLMDKSFGTLDVNLFQSSLTDSKENQMVDTCKCGNVFMLDAQFCRKCGRMRPLAEGVQSVETDSAARSSTRFDARAHAKEVTVSPPQKLHLWGS